MPLDEIPTILRVLLSELYIQASAIQDYQKTEESTKLVTYPIPSSGQDPIVKPSSQKVFKLKQNIQPYLISSAQQTTVFVSDIQQYPSRLPPPTGLMLETNAKVYLYNKTRNRISKCESEKKETGTQRLRQKHSSYNKGSKRDSVYISSENKLLLYSVKNQVAYPKRIGSFIIVVVFQMDRFIQYTQTYQSTSCKVYNLYEVIKLLFLSFVNAISVTQFTEKFKEYILVKQTMLMDSSQLEIAYYPSFKSKNYDFLDRLPIQIQEMVVLKLNQKSHLITLLSLESINNKFQKYTALIIVLSIKSNKNYPVVVFISFTKVGQIIIVKLSSI
ncbi:hypothetical protein ABPG74_017397 [Tetrahymena malaccensis]